ncbi:GNAT family N-acetyltransferase [Streptomyces sp. NPDC050315]|uniref:GNAT family N-acetyltransferase n=1 Tax=Streptomyces sp. NPDC050315 TaxID=3155039 RepID=UPI0034193791
MITLHTQRLTLRRWLPGDLQPMAAVNADPDVMRWIGNGATRSLTQTASGISSWEQEWDIEGFGLFAVELRASGELAGFVGLSVPHFLPEVLPAVEIGWRLGRPYWGRGIATEAARAALDYGFRERGLERIISIAQRGNDASERIMRKLGMRLDRETVDPTCGRTVRVYVIDSPELRVGSRSGA